MYAASVLQQIASLRIATAKNRSRPTSTTSLSLAAKLIRWRSTSKKGALFSWKVACKHAVGRVRMARKSIALKSWPIACNLVHVQVAHLQAADREGVATKHLLRMMRWEGGLAL